MHVSSGMIDKELEWDDFFDGLKIDRNTPEGWNKARMTKEKIRAEIKKGFLSQTEENMSVLFPKLLKEFEELNNETNIANKLF